MSRRRSARARAAAAVLAAALTGSAALAGCQLRRGTGPPREIVETRFLEELSAAIRAVNAARAALAGDANVLGAGAAALDDVDDVAAEGDRAAARARRAVAENALRAARPAARRLGRDVQRYRAAVDKLANADRAGLDPAQRAALSDVVSAARAELGVLRTYATVIAGAWPRYERLDEDQRVWLTRYNGGWYRDAREAAGAYVVMTDRRALARDRRSLASADRRRLAAARQVDEEIERARGALATLLD